MIKKNKKEILCSTCIHQNVCSLRSQLFKVQEAIDNINIQGEQEHSIVELRLIDRIDWIEVSLTCKHYHNMRYVRQTYVDYVRD